MSAPQSPRQDARSDSPSNQSGPSKRPRNTVADLQRRQIEKLLANPDKEVVLPESIKEKTLRAPKDMMKNVQGSSAGAGSGEFHVYKASRRREYERLKLMDDKIRNEEEHASFMQRQAERDAVADAKTAKNRNKRQKRKQGRKGGPVAGVIEGPSGEGGLVKRKLEGGAKIMFRKPGEEGNDSEDEDVGPIPLSVQAVEPEEVAVAQPTVEEKTITIVDED